MLLPNVNTARIKERENSLNRLHGASEMDNPSSNAYTANNLPILYCRSCSTEKREIPNKKFPHLEKAGCQMG